MLQYRGWQRRVTGSVLLATLAVLPGLSAAETTAPAKLQIADHLLTDRVSRPRDAADPVDMIMLHFASDVVKHPDNPYDVNRIADIFTTNGVSAHYLIDRQGQIHRFVREDRVAYHAGKGRLSWLPERTNKLNQHSIGIEMLNVGSWRDMKVFMKKSKYDAFAKRHSNWIGYTPNQYAALNLLIADIRSRHPDILMDRYHIVGHEEYAGIGRRTDPGELFDWRKIGLTKSRPAR